ncbi:piggyBac transposable element-derived protein 3-like isoform X2 [Rhipicephalus sanguineus]|uniref:piggyBac transposable element-derived protein 3-like isoform X2 n=1 Tax=Rhipicephalus sanguineus TaxID=34632 RepID=UPI001893F738|nr:piggyBac transposable element-derived protein 3-like isoform X2 [Rhipicephalus sanguineus]
MRSLDISSSVRSQGKEPSPWTRSPCRQKATVRVVTGEDYSRRLHLSPPECILRAWMEQRRRILGGLTLVALIIMARISDKEAERVLEAITNNDTSDLELSDDEVDDPSFVAPDTARTSQCSDDSSSEEDEEQEPSSSRSLDATWRTGVPYNSAICNVRCPADTFPERRQHWRPSDYFGQYLSDAAFDTMQEKTAVAFRQKTGKILNSSSSEMQNFLGATLMMSCLGYPQMRLYWARGTRVRAIADGLTRDRFFTLRSNLKVVNDLEFKEEDKKNDRLWKVRPILNEVQAGCRKLPRPPYVCIDEQIIPFTGVTTLKQYVPGKPHPTGLKNFVLASPSGLVLDFDIYQGKAFMKVENRPDLGLGPNVVQLFATTLPLGTSLFFDRYFTTLPLIEQLGKMNLRGTGTIMKNRLPMTAKLEDDKTLAKQGRGASSQAVNVSSSTCLVKWIDNKVITIASNHVGEEPFGKCRRWSKKQKAYQDVRRPAVVEEYNRNMGGVDLSDRMLSLYPTTQRTKKWTVRTMIFIADLAAVNSWLQYKEDSGLLGRPKKDILGLLKFKMSLAHYLLSKDSCAHAFDGRTL